MADKTLRTIGELASAGLVSDADIPALEEVARRYAVAITPAMAELIDEADPGDPVARQFIPDARELKHAEMERADPIGDAAHSPVPGVVHRYPDRVLLKLTGICAVYCRFCFRREMVGPGHDPTLSAAALAAAVDYVRRHPSVWEVIVTGGDPLVLSPRRIAEVTAALAGIGHVKVLRWHTRIPVVAPERVTPALIGAIKSPRQTVWLALHANHPRELTPEARSACARIADAGIPMVSQTVLLKGINDDPATLEALLRAFVECRVKPYYLHQGDLAPGTSHLRTTIAEGRHLLAGLRSRLSGLCQPNYVLDIPGGFGKVPITPDGVTEIGRGAYRLRDYRGREHLYRDGAKALGGTGDASAQGTGAPAAQKPSNGKRLRVRRARRRTIRVTSAR
jgi:lysine 2,3-aminomutase